MTDLREAPPADRPDTVVRPPLLYLAGIAAGLVLDWLWPLSLVPQPAGMIAGGVTAAGGITLAGLAIRRFRAAGTNVQTVRPATALVTGGPYRITRNPIYVGLTLVYLGIALGANSAWVAAFIVPLLVILRHGVVLREEAYLEAKFGEAYRTYKAATRRWL